MAKKTFKIRAKFVFDGVVSIKANSRQEAEEDLEKNLTPVIVDVQASSQEFLDRIMELNFSKIGRVQPNRKEEE